MQDCSSNRAMEEEHVIQLQLDGENAILVTMNKDANEEQTLNESDVLQAMIENVTSLPGSDTETDVHEQMETETEAIDAAPATAGSVEAEELEKGAETEDKPEVCESSESVTQLKTEVLQKLWDCTVLTLVDILSSTERCRRSGLLPGDLIAVISLWKCSEKRSALLSSASGKQATVLGRGMTQPLNRFVSISPPNPAALFAASCEAVNTAVLGQVLRRYQEDTSVFDEDCLHCFSLMWYFLHYCLVFYMRGGTVKMLHSEMNKDAYLVKTATLLDRLARETPRDLPTAVLTQHHKKFPHHFCDFIQGFFQMLIEPTRPFLNTHDELSVEDLLRILKMCKIPCPQTEGAPSRNDVMQVLFNASPTALQKVSTCFELTLQQMRQTNLREFWLKLGSKNKGMKDVLTRLADRLDLDYAQIISKQCKELKATFAADLICRLLRQSKHLTTDMFKAMLHGGLGDGDADTDPDSEIGRALIIDMVTRQTKLIIPGRTLETIPMENKDGGADGSEGSETEVVVKGDVIGKIITLSQESGPDKDRLELMSHNCRKYDLLIIRDSGGIKKMSYTGNPGWEVTNEFSPSEAMFVFLRELLMSPIKIMQTDPIVVDITMCYRLLKHLKSEDDIETVFIECDQTSISEPVLTLINGNENVTILIRCCSCVALAEFVEYLQRLAKQDSLDLSHATNLVRKNVLGASKDVLYQDMDVASNIEILGARPPGDLEAVEQSVISYLDENARLKNTPADGGKQHFGLSLLANCIEMNPADPSKKVKMKGLKKSSTLKAGSEPEMEILQRGKGSSTPTVIKVSNLNKSDLPSTINMDDLLGESSETSRSGKKAPVVWIPVMVNQFSTDGGTDSQADIDETGKRKEIMIGIISEEDEEQGEQTAQALAAHAIVRSEDDAGENVVAWQLVDVESAIGQQATGAEVTIQSKTTLVQRTEPVLEGVGTLWTPMSPSSSGNKRDRFPDWLIKQVDFGGIEGLAWVDKSQNVIRMPWKHASSSMWSVDDVELMRRWAVHTGKYAPQLTSATLTNTPKNWKVNFRMSLNLYAQKMAKTRDSLICRIFNKPIKRVGKPIKLDI